MADTSSPALAEKTIVDEIKANTPKCWRTLYHLLELYSTMPETKTLGRRTTSASRLSVIDEEPEKVSQTQSLPRHSHSGLHRSGKQRANTVESVERQTPTSTAAPTTPTSPGAPPGGGSAQHANRVAYTGNTFTQSKAESMTCFYIWIDEMYWNMKKRKDRLYSCYFTSEFSMKKASFTSTDF